jgi:ABC-2 type transport system ATP-binding protein
MIKFNNISKVFKSDLLAQPFTALDEVSFDIPEGSMVGFLGANGAGKTTSLKIIMDFTRPTRGEVSFSRLLGSNKLEIFNNIGFLPERPYFYPSLTGEDFLTFMGKLNGIKLSEIKQEIKSWAPRFKIDHALKRELKTYSKGMLQRIGFLATILHHPKLVILDEPLSGLDPIGRKELKDVIIEVHKEGKTVFFSSHIVPDVEEICDRVIFLKEGKLAYNGPVGSLISDSGAYDYTIYAKNNFEFVLKAPVKNLVHLPENLKKYVVAPSFKDELLIELIQNKSVIISLEMKKPSLEEIFYKTKGPEV